VRPAGLSSSARPLIKDRNAQSMGRLPECDPSHWMVLLRSAGPPAIAPCGLAQGPRLCAAPEHHFLFASKKILDLYCGRVVFLQHLGELRKSHHRGIPATASTAPDPPPQRSASSGRLVGPVAYCQTDRTYRARELPHTRPYRHRRTANSRQVSQSPSVSTCASSNAALLLPSTVSAIPHCFGPAPRHAWLARFSHLGSNHDAFYAQRVHRRFPTRASPPLSPCAHHRGAGALSCGLGTGMPHQELSTFHERRYFGWKVAWAAFVIASCGAGAGLYGPSVLLPVLHATPTGSACGEHDISASERPAQQLPRAGAKGRVPKR
jgi:hypothetical protein